MSKTAREIINEWGLDEEAFEKTDHLIATLNAAGYLIVPKEERQTRGMDDPEWDFWADEADMGAISYNAQIDLDLLAVLKGIAAKKYCTDIAAELGLPDRYIELLQSILCSVGWCDYGTSPRGCWIDGDHDADALIIRLGRYVNEQWFKDAPKG